MLYLTSLKTIYYAILMVIYLFLDWSCYFILDRFPGLPGYQQIHWIRLHLLEGCNDPLPLQPPPPPLPSDLVDHFLQVQ